MFLSKRVYSEDDFFTTRRGIDVIFGNLESHFNTPLDMVIKSLKQKTSKEEQIDENQSNKNKFSSAPQNTKRKHMNKNLTVKRNDDGDQLNKSNDLHSSPENDSAVKLSLHGPTLNPPTNLPKVMSTTRRVIQVQKYLNSLQYDIYDRRNIKVKKSRPLCGLMECAKEIMKESQPIKCLEAVVVALYLTNPCQGLDRFPVSFKSKSEGCIHRHVVLALHHYSIYGALGLSRKSDLMYKPLKYMNLADLMEDFLKSYRENGHEVLKIKIGGVVTHDPHTYETICWNMTLIQCHKLSWDELRKEINQWQRSIGKKSSTWHVSLSNLTMQIRDNISMKKISRKSRKVFPSKSAAKEDVDKIHSPIELRSSSGNAKFQKMGDRAYSMPVLM